MATRRGSETFDFSRARPDDARECVRLRGLTRENAVSEERLRDYGVTVQSWAADIESGALPGWVARSAGRIVGYCFGAAKTGEVVVLALHPAHEGQGLGSHLLRLRVQELRSHGHTRLFLGCSPDPQVRSYGFSLACEWTRRTGQPPLSFEFRSMMPSTHAESVAAKPCAADAAPADVAACAASANARRAATAPVSRRDSALTDAAGAVRHPAAKP